MSNAPDSFDMIDTSPGKPPRGKLIGIVAAVALIAAAALYFLVLRKPSPITNVAATNIASQPGPSASGNTNSLPITTPANTNTNAQTPGPSNTNTTPPPTPPGSQSASSASETVHFGFNQAEVPSEDASKIEALWARIKNGSGTLVIEGHSDNVGDDDYNEALSERRAQAVAAAIKRLGLKDQYKLTIRGVGESKPAESNDTEAGRASNRRAVISISR